MDLIQRKTIDKTVERFIQKAAVEGVDLAWDRYEGQVPECGFCEAGLSCRDCLQGPCISHPFKGDINKVGICGKDKHILAAHTLLRMVIKGTMACLDQAADLASDAGGDSQKAVAALFGAFDAGKVPGIPAFALETWKSAGVVPEGIVRDVVKASQKLEGGVCTVEETLLWAFKCALLGYAASVLKAEVKKALFGAPGPGEVPTDIGALDPDRANLVMYGEFSASLKAKIASACAEAGVGVYAVASEPVPGSTTVPLLTNHASQEVPVMTGAVDLIVAGDQFVNPSLAPLATRWNVPIVSVQGLKAGPDAAAFAASLVEKARDSKRIRAAFSRDVPGTAKKATMGYCADNLDMKKLAAAIESGAVKGVAVFAGYDNTKLSQDLELTTMAELFLKQGILCAAEGDASVALSKYGYLTPGSDISCAEGVKSILDALGTPSVIDVSACGIGDFLCGLSAAAGKDVKDLPVAAVFAEASRSVDVVKAMSAAALGVKTYFWPFLPVSGSDEVMGALGDFCKTTFGGQIHVITRKLAPRVKAAMIGKVLTGEEGPDVSGNPWYGKTGAV
jgi:anaerobic carbon-monoxide dehydrogenase catalytic subunit